MWAAAGPKSAAQRMDALAPLDLRPDDTIVDQLWRLFVNSAQSSAPLFADAVEDAMALWSSPDGLGTFGHLVRLGGLFNATSTGTFIRQLPAELAYELGSNAERVEVVAACALAAAAHSKFSLDSPLHQAVGRVKTSCPGAWRSANGVALIDALVRSEPESAFRAFTAFRSDFEEHSMEHPAVANEMLRRTVSLISGPLLGDIIVAAEPSDVWLMSYLVERPPDRRFERAEDYHWIAPLRVRMAPNEYLAIGRTDDGTFAETYLKVAEGETVPALNSLLSRVRSTSSVRPTKPQEAAAEVTDLAAYARGRGLGGPRPR